MYCRGTSYRVLLKRWWKIVLILNFPFDLFLLDAINICQFHSGEGLKSLCVISYNFLPFCWIWLNSLPSPFLFLDNNISLPFHQLWKKISLCFLFLGKHFINNIFFFLKMKMSRFSFRCCCCTKQWDEFKKKYSFNFWENFEILTNVNSIVFFLSLLEFSFRFVLKQGVFSIVCKF